LQHRKLLTLLDNVRKTRNVFSSGSLRSDLRSSHSLANCSSSESPLGPLCISELESQHAPAGVRCFAARSGGRFVRFWL